jgi:hypothetical protein
MKVPEQTDKPSAYSDCAGDEEVTSGLKTSEVNAEKKFGISQCSSPRLSIRE